ncbi:TM2 domain-containing protein [Methanosarcina sp.]|uniref:TM2 domain-containing protein n=1 Tax=Methanosarcina sp. TaxID=2213 RepID=UPI002ABC66C2|nr:TM2 domain-containing protein [Methanosarcina sp.]MDY9924834.1 TM2 domain-containing protein [Methanosarcina sp.]
MPQPRKSPGIAAVLSFFIPGLGQIYNGQIMKGIIFIILASIFGFLTVVLIGYILYPLFWIYNLYDAYNTAREINERHSGYY